MRKIFTILLSLLVISSVLAVSVSAQQEETGFAKIVYALWGKIKPFVTGASITEGPFQPQIIMEEEPISEVIAEMPSIQEDVPDVFIQALPGDGIAGSPYNISNCLDLNQTRDNLAAYYQLTQDINCSDTVNWDSGAGFLPIGSLAAAFTGNFDGQNHTINDLYINRPSTDYIGLFGYAGAANIYSIGLENVNITGDVYVGGFIGHSYGIITDSYSNGNISGGTNVGGITGRNSGTITDSYSTGRVTCSANGGGLSGGNLGSINKSYSTGNVSCSGNGAGGLVGANSGPITNSYSTGDVSSGGSFVEGFVGFNSGTINNSYWNNHTGNPSNCHDGGNADCVAIADDESYFYDVSNPPLANWSYPPWDSVNDGTDYPVLEWQGVVVAEDTNISSCPRTLSTANTVYTLNQSITTTSYCLNVEANNVTVDCNGYTISGDFADNTEGDDGIIINGFDDATIMNCTITLMADDAIDISNSKGHKIIDSNLSTNYNLGIDLVKVNDSSISETIFFDNWEHIGASSSNYNLFFNNTFDNVCTVGCGGTNNGISLGTNNDGNNFTENDFYTTESYDLNFASTTSNGNIIWRNNFYGSGANDADSNIWCEPNTAGGDGNYFDPGATVVSGSCGTLAASWPSACGTLSTANEVYTLTNDVSSSGTCFTISANNVTIDCGGYMINYSQSSTGYGVNVDGFDVATIRNCEIIQSNSSVSNSHAIRISSSLNNTITSNNITVSSNGGSGIQTQSSSNNNNITYNNVLTLTGSVGISLTSSNSSIMFNNVAGISGISISGSENSIISNNFTGSSSVGASMWGSALFNLFADNIIRSTTSNAITFNGKNNTFENNTVIGNFRGIVLQGSNNMFINNRITGSSFEAVKIFNIVLAFNNTFNSNYVVGGSHGFLISNSNDNVLSNNTIISSNNDLSISESNGTYLRDQVIADYDLSGSNLIIENTSSGKLFFTNTSMTESGTDLSEDIVIGNNSVFVNSSLRPGFNTTANITLYALNFTTPQIIVDHEDDGTFSVCSAPTCNNLSYNASGNNNFVFNVSSFTTYSTQEASACQTLNTEDEIYTLTNDVSSSGTCFDITVNNVTIDCAGYTINYSQSSTGYGVRILTTNAFVKNCNIIQGGSSSNSPGIRFHGSAAQYNTVNNNTITITAANGDSYGVLIGGTYNNITNNTFITYAEAIRAQTGFQNIINNKINVSARHGIRTSDAGSNVKANTINIFSGSIGIIVPSSSSTNIINNTINADVSGSKGIALQVSGSNNRIINNTINMGAASSYGIYLSSVNDNTLSGNIIDAPSALDLQLISSQNTSLIDQPINDYSLTSSGLIIEDTSYGILEFLSTSITETGVNLSADIVIGNNSVFVNSSLRPGFNTTANITLYSLIFANPQILYDLNDNGTSDVCPRLTCSKISYNASGNNNLVFNVTSFTTYSSRETPEITYSEFSGDTTNFSVVDLTDIENMTLHNQEYGKVIWQENIDISSGADFDAYVNISFNRIEVNSSAIPAINKSALIYLYNLTFRRPIILIDGAQCPATQCYELSYNSSNGTLLFNVTHFTIYSAGETPIILPIEVGEPDEDEGIGCYPNYVCEEWSECSRADMQERVCVDIRCTFPNKTETRECLFLFPAPAPEKPVFDLIIKNTYLDKTIVKLREEPFFIFIAWFVILGLVFTLWPVVSKGLKKHKYFHKRR